MNIEQRATHHVKDRSYTSVLWCPLNGWPLEGVDQSVDHEAAMEMWAHGRPWSPIQIRCSNRMCQLAKFAKFPGEGGDPGGGKPQRALAPAERHAHMRRYRSWARQVGVLT